MKLVKLLASAALFLGAASATNMVPKKSPINPLSRLRHIIKWLLKSPKTALKKGSSGEIIVTVEESQGSVQNVMEAMGECPYVFTTPPGKTGT